MNRAASDKRWVVIREYLGTLSEAGLRSVCEAKHWCSGQTIADDGARCFVGHAEDYRRRASGVLEALIPAPLSHVSPREAAYAFDELAVEYGLPPVVLIAKQFAAEVRKGKRAAEVVL